MALTGLPAPSHAFVGIASHDDSCKTGLTWARDFICDREYNKSLHYRDQDDCKANLLTDKLGTEHDQIVSVRSQEGGLNWLAATPREGCSAAHENVVDQGTFADKVAELLDTSVTSVQFSR